MSYSCHNSPLNPSQFLLSRVSQNLFWATLKQKRGGGQKGQIFLGPDLKAPPPPQSKEFAEEGPQMPLMCFR